MLHNDRFGPSVFPLVRNAFVVALVAGGFSAAAYGQGMSADPLRPHQEAPAARPLPAQPTGPHAPAPAPVHTPAQKTGPHDPAPPAQPFPTHKTGPHDPAPDPQPVPWQPTGPDQPAPGPSPAPIPFCFGDGSSVACPCDNNGLAGRGCDNSVATGGALLTMTGVSHLKLDSVKFTAYGELPSALSILFQGDAVVRPVNFGDGLRCVGGNLNRLYIHGAVGGVVSAPQKGDPSVSVRSADLGDPIQAGEQRFYQIYYRDPNPRFCPESPGGTFNVSNALALTWDG